MIDPDLFADQLVREHDDTSMPLPDMEYEPDLLISRVRKHYMEYLIKLLSVNYENHQKPINKNIYLPSAIWRCAKNIEMKAAQMCMVVQLYRKNIVAEITVLKNDTKKGKLNKKLFDCLQRPPNNEKKIQATFDAPESCNCFYSSKQKRRKLSEPTSLENEPKLNECINFTKNKNAYNTVNKIAVITNSNMCQQQQSVTFENEEIPLVNKDINITNPNSSVKMSVDSLDSDELMMQLERLFQCDHNDDDLFDEALCNEPNLIFNDNTKRDLNANCENTDSNYLQNEEAPQAPFTTQVPPRKSLDDRIATLADVLVNKPELNLHQSHETNNERKYVSNKWLCEEYFLKLRLFEMLDKIRDCNRKKLIRIKDTWSDLFGEGSDDEGVLSPLEETPEFITSCKERIAPWVVKLLTPFYIKGRIRGKALFKTLAKHLIRLIYQCSKFPDEHEVTSFVSDFLKTHKLIRCEADFKQFRIDNI